MKGLERFQKQLSELEGGPVTEQEAADAFHNFSDFMSLLIRINEREKVISTKHNGQDHESQ